MKTGDDRNDDIEVLRAISVALVPYEHLGIIHYGPTLQAVRMVFVGWTGVDLFFCISGFVIYRSLSASLVYGDGAAAATRKIVAFWIRRFWRLAPAAWLWLLVGIPAGIAVGNEQIASFYQHIAGLASALLNIENIHRTVCVTNPHPCDAIFKHYWSLSLEAQFYVLLPFAMLLLPRRWLAAFMAALIVVQFPWPRTPFVYSLAWYVRTDAIAWGILIAIATRGRLAGLLRPTFLDRTTARAAFTLGLFGLLAAERLFDAEGIFTGIAGMVSAALVLAASYNAGYVWRPAWATSALRWIGLRSYSLYVAHLIVFRYTQMALHELSASMAGIVLQACVAYALTVLSAALTYRYVERPLRRHGREAAQRYLASTESALIETTRPIA